MPHTRSTRARLHSASESLSQSLPRARRQRRAAVEASKVEEIQESFASASTASLPPDYTIHLALRPHTHVASEEELRHVIRGQELLADGWRRGEREGKLWELRGGEPRARNVTKTQQDQHGQELGYVEADVLWYSAGLRYACSCDLQPLRSSWMPIGIPPTSDAMPSLQPDSRCPLVGDCLPDWQTMPTGDLDPVLDSLDEFKTTWQTVREVVPPPITLFSSQKSALTVVEDHPESPEARRIRKGKYKATTVHSSVTFVSSSPAQSNIPPSQISNSRASSRSISRARQPLLEMLQGANAAGNYTDLSTPDWAARKAWWRSLIRSDAIYDRFWSIIPRPHTLDAYPAKGVRKKRPTVPDFVLPRYYTSTPHHIFTPNLTSWLSSHPKERLYWMIPLHGPVIIPGYSDHDREPPRSAPVPSCATLLIDPLSKSTPSTSPPDIIWTPELLAHFWESFLAPLQSDPTRPFGSLSVRLSGPKPDPFIDFPSSLDPKPSNRPSPGVEVGDHIRVYLDAKYSLRFRTWIRGVEIDSSYQGAGIGEGLIRPFLKIRLVLMTLFGQALIVA
ncbi:hypothetical protein BD324DRAFT_613581 [Kockovaella imperatae]|uniref:Uncharacterized protein n=1 Tax=Kockovaella imperatae TaxID=4999 RepID=A0A1Y1UT49_9TREE|nr:hypothetical protein BD324DRAFT_613581 [Kockovaella imperatae]ORX41193.1 hypothetical protein BD324DRAFT_613581 [Kockovaella imperatae]